LKGWQVVGLAASSWLNLVERWFAELTSRKLQSQLTAASPSWKPISASGSTSGTKRPKPFVWTKSADEILETLAAYCQRIIDPGHQR
jgi:hypothetical protein